LTAPARPVWGYVDSADSAVGPEPVAAAARAHIPPDPTTESQPECWVAHPDRFGNMFKSRNYRKNRPLGNIFI